MRMHVEALFVLDAAGRLVRGNEPGGGPAPRFFIGRTMEGNRCWFRHDLDSGLVAALEASSLGEAGGAAFLERVQRGAEYESLLATAAPVQRRWSGPAYHFPDTLPRAPLVVRVTEANAGILRPHLEPWLPDVAMGTLMMAVVVGGEAVAVCGSVRITETAHEAGVETAPAFRCLGHGAQAVAAWGRVVFESGRIPLYSTSWENTASLALARRLGLVHFGSELHIT
jgi:hypothetical protein